jgi:hypothetical protein
MCANLEIRCISYQTRDVWSAIYKIYCIWVFDQMCDQKFHKCSIIFSFDFLRMVTHPCIILLRVLFLNSKFRELNFVQIPVLIRNFINDSFIYFPSIFHMVTHSIQAARGIWRCIWHCFKLCGDYKILFFKITKNMSRQSNMEIPESINYLLKAKNARKNNI